MPNPEVIAIARAKDALRAQSWNDGFDEFLSPSWRLHPKRTAMTDIPLGASRLGGVPDVPRGFAWPTKRNGEPLNFLAQIAMGDVSQPDRGALVFFYDDQSSGHASQHGAWHVIDVPRGAVLERRHATPGVHLYSPCCIAVAAEATLPSPESMAKLSGRAAPFATARDHDAYVSFRASLTAPLTKPCHRFLGQPDEIQTSLYAGFASALVERPARTGINPFTKQPHTFPRVSLADTPPDIVSFLRSTTEWRLLLQLDSDSEGPDWMWGNRGIASFWISEIDFAQWRLDRVWLTLDSY